MMKRAVIIMAVAAALVMNVVEAQHENADWYRELDPDEEIIVGAGPISVPIRMQDFYSGMEEDPVLFVQSLVDLIEMLVGEYGSIQALGFTEDEVTEIRSSMSLVLAHLTPHAKKVMPEKDLTPRQADMIRVGIDRLKTHARNNEIEVDLDALEEAMLSEDAEQRKRSRRVERRQDL
eukprot:Selendium_serpulae@DN3843_c0_g1_i2.p1